MTLFSPQNMTAASTPSPFVAAAGSFFHATQAPYLVFNGSIAAGQYWQSDATSADWLSLDIGSGNSEILAQYTIIKEIIESGTKMPKDWTMEGSNTGAFAGEEDILDTVTGETGWTTGAQRTFVCDIATTAYRYFRINITDNNGSSHTVMGELLLYSAIPFSPTAMTGASTPAPFVASASSSHVALLPYEAFNSLLDTGNYWITNVTSTGWLQLDIGSGNSEILGSYNLVMNTVPEANRSPKDWTVLGSNTGAFAGEEDILDTVTGEVSWGAGELRNFICDVTTTPYRYFRIDITDNNGDAYLQIGNWLLFGLSQVEIPIILPTSGAYPASQLISMTCATSGADIYYTLDGSTPDSGDNLYSTPFTLNSAKTIKAIGIKSGFEDSNVVTEVYTIAASYNTKLYINNVLINTFGASSNLIDADAGGSFIGQLQSSLGGGFDGNKSLDGILSKTRFYQTKVNQAKVTELFDELKLMPSGQIVHYRMDLLTNSGTNLIDSNANYNGTVSGGITVEQGIIGGCLNLNGIDGLVNLDGFAAELDGSTTMLGLSFWINTSTLPTTNPNAIFSLNDSIATSLLQVGIQTEGKLYIYTPDLGTTDIDLGDITDDEWQKLSTIFYADSCYLYINKEVVNISRTAGFGTIMSSVTKVTIGAEYSYPGSVLTPDNFYTGKADDFRIFLDTDINSAEEAFLYEIGKPLPGVLVNRLNSKLNIKMRSTRDTYDSLNDFDFNLNRSGYGYNYGNFYGE